jgi:hypothetical protein
MYKTQREALKSIHLNVSGSQELVNDYTSLENTKQSIGQAFLGDKHVRRLLLKRALCSFLFA